MKARKRGLLKHPQPRLPRGVKPHTIQCPQATHSTPYRRTTHRSHRPQHTVHKSTMSQASNNLALKSRIESLAARMIAIGLKGQALLDIIE
jgi:hypothetical protein